MKENLLVTLADENYIDQAKQLFSSAFWNAGWKGDYMLLSHEIPEEELKWFRDKGILIKECKPLHDMRIVGWPITVLSKFYLFMPEFKEWKNIIFLDSDIIVRASLDELTKIKGFAARHGDRLGIQFIKPKLVFSNSKSKKINRKLFNELKKNYNLKEHGINSGVIAFNTDIIKRDTFSEIQKLVKSYGKIRRYATQSILSLLFYKKFIMLPYVYNCWPDWMIHYWNIKPEKIKGIILHFLDRNKPWLPKNPFYAEWENNLKKAESINLNNTPFAREIRTEEDIKNYCEFLQNRRSRYFYRQIFYHNIIWRRRIPVLVDKIRGFVGIFLKKNFPKLYFWLKKLKEKNKVILK